MPAYFTRIWKETSKALGSRGYATSTVKCHMSRAFWNCVSVRSKISRPSVASSKSRSRIIRSTPSGAPGCGLEHGKAVAHCWLITTTGQSARFTEYDYLVVPTAQLFPFDANLDWPKEIAGRKMETY